MINLSSTEIKILKILNEKYNEDPMHPFTSGDNLHLTEKLHISRNEANVAIKYLEDKGLIKLQKYFGQDFYQDYCSITSEGINAMREIESPSQQNPGTSAIYFNAPIVGSVIGNGNIVSITIEDSFNSLRALASSDKSREIISEMKQEANSRRPSLDKLRDLGKDFLAEAGDAAKQTIVNLISAVLINSLGM